MESSAHTVDLAQKIHGRFDGEGSGRLAGLCLDLLSEQKRTWPALGQSYAALKSGRLRDVPCKGFSVRLQHNPGRITSTLARVGVEDTKERPCFLCLRNLPNAQKGIVYRGDYLILCNPMPVFSSHFTISHLHHRPQSITEHMATFLALIADCGEGWALLYNGPQCGASAPDHLHFQAIPSGLMPFVKEVREEGRLLVKTQVDGGLLSSVQGLGREAVVLEGDNPTALEGLFKEYLKALKNILATDGEPMINMAGFREEKQWRLVIFPRRKHRPDIFFRDGDDRVLVSPAVVEMGGVLVTPREKDFEGLHAALVESIYREVSLDSRTAQRAVDAMGAG